MAVQSITIIVIHFDLYCTNTIIVLIYIVLIYTVLILYSLYSTTYMYQANIVLHDQYHN